jgi:hypothetical protein
MLTRITISLALCLAIAQASAGQQRRDDGLLLVEQLGVIQSLVHIRDRTEGARGTGFVVGGEAFTSKLVLTCAHVAEKGHEFEVDFFPHGTYDVRDGIRLVAYDEQRDLALLRVPTGRMVTPVDLADSSTRPSRGQEAVLMGFPGGELSMQQGNVVRCFHKRAGGMDANVVELARRFGAGGSGSPVLCRSSSGRLQVVAVYYGYSGESGRASTEVCEFLRENGFGRLGGRNGEAQAMRRQEFKAVMEKLARMLED